jgi:hypothetical protein
MFGFGKVPCLLCDRQVTRKEALAVQGQKGFAVCRGCIEGWQARGGKCPKCQTPLWGGQQAGIFLQGRRSFGHADCGATRLVAA